MSKHYSAFALARHALDPDMPWPKAWESPEPRSSYDVVIVGGGGHGLATAYYLAKNHGITNVAVIEKSYIGSGNVGRNTTLIRSNYMIGGNTAFFEHSLKLWEGLSHELNFNCMVSQRGQIVLAVNPVQMDVFARRGNTMRLNGIDAELLDAGEVRKLLPYLDWSKDARWPIYGAIMQPRAGTVRHDAVAWGYARAASALGVHIIENCEVTGFVIEDGKCSGVETSRGRINAGKVGIAVAGNTSRLAQMAGLVADIETIHSPVGFFEGSNAWAVQGKKTVSGKPILSGDPHIAHSCPSVWYEAHIITPDLNFYGHFLSGFPLALMGFNQKVAWTLTMFQNDDLDLFVEKPNPENPDQVWSDGKWTDLEIEHEIIKVKRTLREQMIEESELVEV